MTRDTAAETRDPIDIAEDFVQAAVVGEEWETRSDGEYGPLSFVERGVGGSCERFLSVSVPYLDACKIEALLAFAARVTELEAELRTVRRGLWNHWHDTPARDCADLVLSIDRLLGDESRWLTRFAEKFPTEAAALAASGADRETQDGWDEDQADEAAAQIENFG